MPIVHLIRHAKAQGRDEWPGEDSLRPLRASGTQQAKRLAELFPDPAPVRIICSPAARCVETITPLAERFDTEINVDELCFEGRRLALPDDAGVTVLCAHGDNIPDLLGRLKLEWYKCEMASTWRLELDVAGAVLNATYLDPPGS